MYFKGGPSVNVGGTILWAVDRFPPAAPGHYEASCSAPFPLCRDRPQTLKLLSKTNPSIFTLFFLLFFILTKSLNNALAILTFFILQMNKQTYKAVSNLYKATQKPLHA